MLTRTSVSRLRPCGPVRHGCDVSEGARHGGKARMQDKRDTCSADSPASAAAWGIKLTDDKNWRARDWVGRPDYETPFLFNSQP
jgi:hypothetical protein